MTNPQRSESAHCKAVAQRMIAKSKPRSWSDVEAKMAKAGMANIEAALGNVTGGCKKDDIRELSEQNLAQFENRWAVARVNLQKELITNFYEQPRERQDSALPKAGWPEKRQKPTGDTQYTEICNDILKGKRKLEWIRPSKAKQRHACRRKGLKSSRIWNRICRGWFISVRWNHRSGTLDNVKRSSQ